MSLGGGVGVLSSGGIGDKSLSAVEVSILIGNVFEFELGVVGASQIWEESWATASSLNCVETGLTDLEVLNGDVLGRVSVGKGNELLRTALGSVVLANVFTVNSICEGVGA